MCSALAPVWPTSSCKPTWPAVNWPAALCKLSSKLLALSPLKSRPSKLSWPLAPARSTEISEMPWPDSAVASPVRLVAASNWSWLISRVTGAPLKLGRWPDKLSKLPPAPKSTVKPSTPLMPTMDRCRPSMSLRLVDRWVLPAASKATWSCAANVKPSVMRVCAWLSVMCSALAPVWPTSSCKPTLPSCNWPAALCKLSSKLLALSPLKSRPSKLSWPLAPARSTEISEMPWPDSAVASPVRLVAASNWSWLISRVTGAPLKLGRWPDKLSKLPPAPKSTVKPSTPLMPTMDRCRPSMSLRLVDRWVLPAASKATWSCAAKDRPSVMRVCAWLSVMCSALAPVWPTSSCTLIWLSIACKVERKAPSTRLALPSRANRLSKLLRVSPPAPISTCKLWIPLPVNALTSVFNCCAAITCASVTSRVTGPPVKVGRCAETVSKFALTPKLIVRPSTAAAPVKLTAVMFMASSSCMLLARVTVDTVRVCWSAFV